MPLEHRNFDPASMAGASLNVQLDLGEILDANANEMLEFDTVASAVNFFRMANAATAGEVNLSAQGDDANVGISVSPKGSGTVRFVMSTPVGLTAGGAVDFQQLGRSDPHFVVRTTSFTPLTATGRTTANTTWLEVRLDTPTGTRRFIQVYD